MPSILPSRGGAHSMVEQQIKRWSLLQAKQRPLPTRPQAVITLSREFGARGAELGRMVAEELGFSFWDQEIVHEIAARTGAAEQLLNALDEQARSTVEELVIDTLSGPLATESEYVRQLTQVIHTIANQGKAVIVGRGAYFILPADRALRVRIFAPIDVRIRGYAERNDLDEKAAAREVRNRDRDRAAFHRQQFGQDVEDPHHYDLLINTAGIPIDVAAQMVVASYQARFGRQAAAKAGT